MMCVWRMFVDGLFHPQPPGKKEEIVKIYKSEQERNSLLILG